MTQYGTWVSYGGAARIELAVSLLIVALGVTAAGKWLPLPARARRPGRAVVTFMLATWVLAIATFGICLAAYALQVLRSYPGSHVVPADDIFPVTVAAAIGTSFVILIASPQADGARTRLASATVGAMAAPMIFELPFDLIVMARTYPAVPPHPAVYRALFFLPLFLVEITTVSLLTVSPMVKLSRGALFSFAAMLAVFAVWSLFGFAYPSAPLPVTLNVLSKLLAFVTVLCLFLPQRARARTPEAEPAQAIGPAQTDEVRPA